MLKSTISHFSKIFIIGLPVILLGLWLSTVEAGPLRYPLVAGPTPLTPLPTNDPNATPIEAEPVTAEAGTPIPQPTHTRIPDYSPPNTTLQLTGEGTAHGWYRSPVTLTFVVTDDMTGLGLTQYKFHAAVKWQEREDYDPPVVVTAEGIHPLEYRSIDKLSNVEAVHTTVILIDLTSPTAVTPTLTGIRLADGRYNAPVSITFSGQDNLSDLDYYDLSLNGSNWFTVTTNYVVAASGRYSLTYRGVDHAGNISASKVITFTVEGEAITTYLPLILKPR